MKAKVLKSFRDRHTGEIHKTGKVMTISRERYEEILAVAPLVAEVKTKTKKVAESEE